MLKKSINTGSEVNNIRATFDAYFTQRYFICIVHYRIIFEQALSVLFKVEG